MTSISVSFDEKLMKRIKLRADKNYLTAKEQIEDIVRRSMLTWNKRPKRREIKVDDELVNAFTRSRRGRKKKK